MDSQALLETVTSLRRTYGAEITEIAALVFTTRRLVTAAGRQHRADTSAMLTTLDKCVESRLIDLDLHPMNLVQCLRELEEEMLMPA